MKKRREKAAAAAERAFLLLLIWACAGFVYRFLPNAALLLPAAGLATALLALAWMFPERARRIGGGCLRLRWMLALLAFLLCVGLRLHGSSIGVYDEVFPAQIVEKENTLFGVPRRIRADEYGVATPKFFSQAANGYRLYSTRMSLSPTNMVLDYYSPVRDWTILGKPLAWGFLLLGNEAGLSWYWCGEIILLFMTALEMCLILTGGMRREALTGAFMIALSPAVQWWVMPHMPPVILYSMSLFCIGYRFFTAKKPVSKWGAAGLSVIAVTGFALSVFPSFQVPCGGAALILLAACLLRDRGKLTFTLREWPRVALPAAAALLILGRFVQSSAEDLARLLGTAYPGQRMSLGGGVHPTALFTDITSLFLPYRDINFLNNCEAATYLHAAPLFLALSPRLVPVMKKKRDPAWIVGAALTGVLLVQCAFMLIGFPQWLAEITLLRFCNRMHEVYGWTAALYTVWGLSALARYPQMLGRRAKAALPLLYGAACLRTVDRARREYFAHFAVRGVSLGGPLIALSIAAIVFVLYLAVLRRRRLLGAVLILAMLFCGGTVNPVERGIGAVTNHPVSAAVSRIAAEEPEARWLSAGTGHILSNFLLAGGARVLSATNFYPDPGKWAILDPAGQYADVTNRYANQRAELTGEKTSVDLLGPDYLRIRLNPESLKALEIRYLFARKDHSRLLSEYGIACTHLAGQDGYGIWRLDYGPAP